MPIKGGVLDVEYKGNVYMAPRKKSGGGTIKKSYCTNATGWMKSHT